MQKLRHAPLVHVLAQISYPRLLSPEDCLKSLRQSFQELEFPRFVEGSLHRVTIVEGAAPQVAISPRWDFVNRDRTEGVQVTDSWTTLRTTAYTTVEPFLERLGQVLDVIKARVDVQLVERLGLRYVDRVTPRDGERISQYVDDRMLGFPTETLRKTSAVLQALVTETVARTQVGTLAVRTRLLPSGAILPPDLAPSPLREPGVALADQVGLSLDFDHFAVFETEAFDYEVGAIVDRMDQLHAGVREAFDVIVTEHALNVWGPWEDA